MANGMANGMANSAQVETQDGQLYQGVAVVVTVPLGCLQNDTITFDPPLPAFKQHALRSLRTGLLNKVRWMARHVS